MQATLIWIGSGVVALLGIVGLFLSANARDNGIYLFGLTLFVFALVFIFRQIKDAFDRAEAAGRVQ
jgi:hypothetical protein